MQPADLLRLVPAGGISTRNILRPDPRPSLSHVAIQAIDLAKEPSSATFLRTASRSGT